MGECGGTCIAHSDQELISPQPQRVLVVEASVRTLVLSGICMGKHGAESPKHVKDMARPLID